MTEQPAAATADRSAVADDAALPVPAPAPVEPPLTGGGLVVAVVVFTVMGAALGVVSAFLVPLAPVGKPLVSAGVALGLVGSLLLAALAVQVTGERLAGLASATGWLVVALLANTKVHGDLVLTQAEPGAVFLYSGVVGAGLGLWVPQLLASSRRRRTR